MKINWQYAPEMIRWNRLRCLRKEKGFSVTMVAAGAGISPATVSYIEHGFDSRVTEDTKNKIARFFEVDIDDIFPVEMLGGRPVEEILAEKEKKLIKKK